METSNLITSEFEHRGSVQNHIIKCDNCAFLNKDAFCFFDDKVELFSNYKRYQDILLFNYVKNTDNPTEFVITLTLPNKIN